MIYEMVAGCLPFEGDSIADIFAAILHKEPLPIANYVPDAPEELQLVVSNALEKDSNERYQTMNELALDPQNLRDEFQVQSRLERSNAKKSISKWAHRRTHSLTAGATQTTIALSSDNVSPRFTSSAEYIVYQVKTQSHRHFTIGAGYSGHSDFLLLQAEACVDRTRQNPAR